MMIIRTILFQAYMWIELLLLMFVWLRVQWANHFSPREKRDALVDRIVRNWAKRLLFMAGAKVTVTGRENIPEGRTCVFASNHQSFFDILVLLAHLDRPHAILSKASIGKVPMIRLWMKEIHCVYVDRSDMKAGIEAINRMIDVIKDGYSPVISLLGLGFVTLVSGRDIGEGLKSILERRFSTLTAISAAITAELIHLVYMISAMLIKTPRKQPISPSRKRDFSAGASAWMTATIRSPTSICSTRRAAP